MIVEGLFMDCRELLKSKGLKVTKARFAILHILYSALNSLSAEEIFNKCKDMKIGINLSTVYRCLECYESNDVVTKFSSSDGVYLYKLKREEHKHIITCSICHQKVEIPCPMSQFEELVEKETGFTVTSQDIVIKGVCDKCKKKGLK